MASPTSNENKMPDTTPPNASLERAAPESTSNAAVAPKPRRASSLATTNSAIDTLLIKVDGPSPHCTTGGDDLYTTSTYNEDTALYVGDEQPGFRDEVDEGYVDDDASMDLNDVADIAHEEDSNGDGDKDDIHDWMNIIDPSKGYMTGQEVPKDYVHDALMRGKTGKADIQRAILENELTKQFLEQEKIRQLEYDGVIEAPHDFVFNATQAYQAQTGLSIVGDHDIENESLETLDRRASRLFSPGSVTNSSTRNGQSLFNQTPKRESSENAPDAVMTGTPFTKTLDFFKQFKGKKESPTKGRRKTFMPQEIQNLCVEADKEEEDLKKYRKLDLAPMEPVPENDRGGYLDNIQISTESLDIASPFSELASESLQTVEQDTVVDQSNVEHLPVKQVSALGETEQCRAVPTTGQAVEDGTTEVRIDDTADPEQMQMILYPQHPTFINVIGLVPKALFWVAAAQATNVANKAYGVMIRKFTGLEL